MEHAMCGKVMSRLICSVSPRDVSTKSSFTVSTRKNSRSSDRNRISMKMLLRNRIREGRGVCGGRSVGRSGRASGRTQGLASAQVGTSSRLETMVMTPPDSVRVKKSSFTLGYTSRLFRKAT